MDNVMRWRLRHLSFFFPERKVCDQVNLPNISNGYGSCMVEALPWWLGRVSSASGLPHTFPRSPAPSRYFFRFFFVILVDGYVSIHCPPFWMQLMKNNSGTTEFSTLHKRTTPRFSLTNDGEGAFIIPFVGIHQGIVVPSHQLFFIPQNTIIWEELGDGRVHKIRPEEIITTWQRKIIMLCGTRQSHVSDTNVIWLSAHLPHVPKSHISVLITLPWTCHDSAGPNVTRSSRELTSLYSIRDATSNTNVSTLLTVVFTLQDLFSSFLCILDFVSDIQIVCLHFEPNLLSRQ